MDGFGLTTEDEILGYLDEVFRKRIPIEINIKGRKSGTDILYLDEKNKIIRIQADTFSNAPHGIDALVGFALDRTWWTFQSKYVLVGDKPHILVPKVIKHSERRNHARTAFTAREQVKVTVLEGMGSGNGVFGMATDIGTGGLCMTIEKAMKLNNEKEIAPTEELFAKGTKLSFVKINRIPGCPLIEINGIVNRVYRDGKWRLAIEFEKVPKNAKTAIERFVMGRVLEFKPIRRSKKRREEREEVLVGSKATQAPPTKATPPTADNGPKDEKPAPAEAAPENSATVTEPQQMLTETTPTPEPAPTPTPTSTPPMDILVFGEEMKEDLAFLESGDHAFNLHIESTPVGILKTINEKNPPLILCGTEFKDRSVVDILEKISNMGVLENRDVVICSDQLAGKDTIKLKMLKVRQIYTFSLENQEEFVEILKKMALIAAARA